MHSRPATPSNSTRQRSRFLFGRRLPALSTLVLGSFILGACSGEADGVTSPDEVASGTGGLMSGSGATTGTGGGLSTGGYSEGSTGSGGFPGSGGLDGSGGAVSTGGLEGTGGAIGTGGVTTGGTGGSVSTGGSSSGGTSGTGGSATGGSSGTGGATGTSADQCKPIGWATRSGRTGGAVSVTGGGSTAPIVVKTFADLAKYAADGQARVIHIDGNLGGGWSGVDGDRLEIKSNKTIIGIRAQTQLKAAIHIKDASNVILRNIVVRGPGSNNLQAWDNINIEGNSKNVWVDHAEFWDGQDGNADVVKGADNVTFTWTIFGYTTNGGHNLSNLIGSSDNEPASVGKLNITYMFNWWKGAAQRQPRCRYGYVHVVNNLYTEDASVGESQLGVSNGYSCNVLTENNHFIDQNEPIDLGKEAGDGSVQQAVGNLFQSCSGNTKGSGTAFKPPYEYSSFLVNASEVKALVQKYAGATLSSPTACAK